MEIDCPWRGAVENEGNQRKISILLFFSILNKNENFYMIEKKFFHTSGQFRGPVIEGKSGNCFLIFCKNEIFTKILKFPSYSKLRLSSVKIRLFFFMNSENSCHP